MTGNKAKANTGFSQKQMVMLSRDESVLKQTQCIYKLVVAAAIKEVLYNHIQCDDKRIATITVMEMKCISGRFTETHRTWDR